MTAKQIEIELQKVFPSIYCDEYPVHCIALPFEKNYNEYWVEIIDKKGLKHNIGVGRTIKKAWVNALENKDKFLKYVI